MVELNPEITNRIKDIHWFAHCTEPFQLTLSMDVMTISSWEDAKRFYHSREWDYAVNEAKNVLSGYLSVNYPSAYNGKWNEAVSAANAFMAENVYPKVIAFKEQMGLDDAFVGSVRWDIRSAIMEDVYRDCHGPTNFFTELLMVYESGHFPCGWAEGRWPHGKLVVI